MKKPDYDKLLFLILQILDENDGVMKLSALMEELDRREGEGIDGKFKRPTKYGNFLWQNNLQGLANIFVKAGYVIKDNGVWRLRQEGEEALAKGQKVAIKEAKDAGKGARNAGKEAKDAGEGAGDAGKEAKDAQKKAKGAGKKKRAAKAAAAKNQDGDDGEVNHDNFHDMAKTGIEEYIRSLDDRQFQNLGAALFRGMGYYISSNSSGRGPDKGIDIIACNDPMGSLPRFKVQVKHSKKNVGRPVFDQLVGVMGDGDIGVLMSSSGFTKPCKDAAHYKDKHIELIDVWNFIDLWGKYYDNLSPQDQSLLPLKPIYFLKKQES